MILQVKSLEWVAIPLSPGHDLDQGWTQSSHIEMILYQCYFEEAARSYCYVLIGLANKEMSGDILLKGYEEAGTASVQMEEENISPSVCKL